MTIGDLGRSVGRVFRLRLFVRRLAAVVMLGLAPALIFGCGSDDSRRTETTAGSTRSIIPMKFKVGAVNPDSTSVRIVIEGGYCYGNRAETTAEIDHVDIEDNKAAVTLTAFVSMPDGFCRGIGYTIRQDIELDEPLGFRTVLDGSRDPAVPRASGASY